MKTRRTIKGTSTGGILEQAYTPSNPPPYPVVTNGSYPNMTVGEANSLPPVSGVAESVDYYYAVNPNGRKPYEVVGDRSVAFGYYSIADGEYTVAIGNGANAEGNHGTAVGDSTFANGESSTAIGNGARTSRTDADTMQLGSTALSVLRCEVNLTVTSDERDKTDINNITNALLFIDKLNPVTFVSNDRENYISDADRKSENFRKYGMCEYDRIAHATGTKKGERRRCGLLAQEVIAAMQEVYGTDNYANIVNDNFHDLKEKPSDVENKYTLAYANLVPFLIGAIKELNAKIKELEGK